MKDVPILTGTWMVAEFGRWLVAARQSPRRVRAAWVSGPLAVASGAAAHLVSGEAVPGPGILLAMATLLSMAASILAGVSVPAWVLFVASGVVQQVLHLMLSAFSGDVGGPLSGHAHQASVWPPPQPVPISTSHHSLELMLDTHVAAALLTAVAIAQSDFLISRISRLLPAHSPPLPPRP